MDQRIFDHDTNVAVGKISIAAGGAGLVGLTLNEWVAVITIVYVVAQTILLIPKYLAMFRAWRAKRLEAKQTRVLGEDE